MDIQTPWLKGKATGIVQVLNENNGEWVSLIDPSAMTTNTYDLDSGEGTGRNQNGEMFRDRVAVKEKIEMTFPPMYRVDYVTLLSLVKKDFFQVKYFSDYQGQERIATMYVGDRKATLYYGFDADNPSQAMVKDVQFNFIEK